MNRVKYSTNHFLDKKNGFVWTQMEGGKSKSQVRHGVQPWKKYRTCSCPGGKHRGLPSDDYVLQYDMFTNDGYPKAEPLEYCTECPVTCWEIVMHFHARSGNYGEKGQRPYAKWSVSTNRFTKEDYGRDTLHDNIQEWLEFQGANPNGTVWHNNGGRKASGQLCDVHGVPYEHSMDVHSNRAQNWKYYQPNCVLTPGFKRRHQHSDDLECCKGPDMIYASWNRGRLAGKIPPPVPTPERMPKRVKREVKEEEPKEEEKTETPPETIDLTTIQTDLSDLKSTVNQLNSMVRMLLDKK